MPPIHKPVPIIAHHFNRFTRGGAAIAAIRIARALEHTGCQVSFWHKEGESRAPLSGFGGGSLYYAKPNKWIYAWHKKRHEQARINAPFFSPPWFYDRPLFDPQLHGDGILHMQWLGLDWIDYEAFFNSIPDNHPIVWTLHDVNPLTGGCHLAGDCQGFTRQCGHCPLLDANAEHDITRRAMEIKLRVLRGKNLHFVAPSTWMEQKIKASSIGQLAKSIRVIHNPLDTHAFSPIPQAEAKRALGITTDLPVIAFGASLLNEAHKGIHHLVQALLKIKDEVKFQLLIFGNDVPSGLENTGIPYQYVGFISHQPLQRLLYSCADFYALPSMEDNSPQMGIEALACGTPVVGFRTGGIPDFVKESETGLLAKKGDTDALAMKIKEALNNPNLMCGMRPAARATAVSLFESGQQAVKYRMLYEEACGQ